MTVSSKNLLMVHNKRWYKFILKLTQFNFCIYKQDLRLLFQNQNRRKLHPFVYTLSDGLECFTITKQREQTNDVDEETGQVEDKKGIVSAAVKMKNIKQYSTDDCKLAKPLQRYLQRHIKTMQQRFWKATS